jgi:prevent-host-death family protein
MTKAEKATYATIKSTDLQRKTGSVLKRVAVGKERLVIEREGYPIAVILPFEQGPADTERLLDELVNEIGPRLRAKGLTEENLVGQLRQTRKTLARKKYGKAAKK